MNVQLTPDTRTRAAEISRAQTVMLWGALAFLASGVFHVAVWLGAGMPSLEGPVSWRKPIAFGLSTGVLAASLAWVIGLLPQTTRLYREAVAFVVLLVAELSLINMQQWRGVGSHFNGATAFDGAVFTTMGVLIMIVAVIIAMWTRRLFRDGVANRLRDSYGGQEASAVHASVFAARAGMVLLNIGNLMGVFLAVWGGIQGANGLPPNVFGEAGQLKVPHAVALHAIQVLPLIAWLGSGTLSSLRNTRVAALAYVGIFSFTILQTFSGRAPHDVTIASALLLLVSLSAMGWAVIAAASAKRERRYSMLATWDAAR